MLQCRWAALEVKVSDYDDPLTEAEFTAFRPNAEVIRYLEETRERLGLQRYEMNVLDWGSGRGEYVAWLRDAGYNAFGAEIRRDPTQTVIPFYCVDAVCEVPFGSYPGNMPYEYFSDEEHLRHWLDSTLGIFDIRSPPQHPSREISSILRIGQK